MAARVAPPPPPPPPFIFNSLIFRRTHLKIWKVTTTTASAARRTRQALLKPQRISHLPLLFPQPHLSYLPFHHSSNLISHPRILRRQFLSPPMASESDSAQAKRVKVVIKGVVQGVFYRNWTVDNARELGLQGWVCNRRDGTVEALFSGDADKVDEMEQRCRRGPPDAMVRGLDVSPCSDDPGTGFERRPTV